VRLDCLEFALLAMTSHAFAFSRRAWPEAYWKISPFRRTEGAGNAGCPMHPQPGVRSRVVICTPVFTAEAPENIRHSPRNGFTAYNVLSPATNSSCHRRPADWMASHVPVGLSMPPRGLTSTTDARTTRLHRPQRCRSSRAPLSTAHELPRPATSCAHDSVASIASRPTFRDDWP